MSSEQTNEYAIQLPGAFFNHAAAARSERAVAVRRMTFFRDQLSEVMDHFRTLARGNYAARKQVEAFIRWIEPDVLTKLFGPDSLAPLPAEQQAGFLEAMAVNRAFFARDLKAGKVRRTALRALADNPESHEVLTLLSPETASYIQQQFKMLHGLRHLHWVESAF